jgi:hypothetical protein
MMVIHTKCLSLLIASAIAFVFSQSFADNSPASFETIAASGLSIPTAAINLNFVSAGSPTTLDGSPHSSSIAPSNYAGTRWNEFEGKSNLQPTERLALENMLDSNGDSTTASIAISYTSMANFPEATLEAARDGFRATAEDGTIEIAGLPPESLWSVYIVTQGQSADEGTSVTLNDTTLVSTGADPTTDSFDMDANFLLFSELTTDENGRISGTFGPAAGATAGHLSALQLVPGPTNTMPHAHIAHGEWLKIGQNTDADVSVVSNDEFTISWTVPTDGRNDIGALSALETPVRLSNGESLTFSFTMTDIVSVIPSNLPIRFGLVNDLNATSGNHGAFIAHVAWGVPPSFTKFKVSSNTNGNPFSTGSDIFPVVSDSPGPDVILVDGNTVDFSYTVTKISDDNYAIHVEWGKGDQGLVISGGYQPPVALNHFNNVFVLANQWMPGGATFRIINPQVEKRFAFAVESVDRIEQLKEAVAALPNETPEENIKRALLELALERSANARDRSMDDEFHSLADNVELGLPQDPSNFALRAPDAPEQLALLRPLFTKTNNPYLAAMVDKANQDLLVPDVSWPRATVNNPTISDIGGSYGSRTAYLLMSEYLWLFAHEESPMRNDPNLLKRIMRRAHAYIDALELDPDGGNNQSNPFWYDQFSIMVAFPALYEIYHLYPGLLLPSERERWDAAMEAVAIQMQGWHSLQRNYSPWNINIETGRHIGALVAGLWTGSQWHINRVIEYIDRVIARVLPDGAIPYHGIGNPSVNYHNDVLQQWLIIYELTGYEPLLQAMADTQWKGSVMGRTDEFWTSPHYKTERWNFERGTEAGSEAVAALSRNPYLRWLLDRDMFPAYPFPGTNVPNRYQVAWYDPSGISAEPLPDNYTIPDRNVGGPRAWYGNFNYSGSFMPNPNQRDYEGHETLIGAMTVDPQDGRLNSILTAVTPRIWQTPEATIDPIGGHELSAWALMTINEIAATTITRNYSVATSIHGTTRQRAFSRRTTDDSGWTSRQLWIGLPDRILGLVSTVPTADEAAAYAVNGVLRLVSGGTAGAATTKVLQEVTPNQHYRYGQLDIIVHYTTYSSISGFELEYRRDLYPATELTFSDRESEPLPVGDQSIYPADTDFRFVVEVRPTWTTTDLASLTMLGDRDLLGLELISDTTSLQVWLNAANSDQVASLQRQSLPEGNASFTLSDGVLGRAPFHSNVPSSVTLAPGQHAVLVVSSDRNDHRVGWESFAHMVGHAWANYQVDEDGWLDTGDWLGHVYPIQDFLYSQLFSNYFYLPAHWVNPQAGSFAYVNRDPGVPSLVDGIPLEGAVLPQNGWVDTQTWLGWLFVVDDGWVYSRVLQDWFCMPTSHVNEFGAWLYFPR